MTELIHRTRLDGGVLLAEIDRPPANAYNFELLDALEALAADPEARVVVLASRLDRIFCAGADLGAFLGLDPERRSDLCARCREVQNAIECSSRPFLALIEGACLGGGAEIALSCDVRFMARGARIGFPEVKLGLLPASGGTQNLPRRVGRGRALDLLLSGRSLDADEALAAGLVEHVGEAEAVRDAALDLAARIAGMPPEAVAAIKDAVVRGLRVSLAEGMTLELEHVGQRFADPRTDPRLREALAGGGRGEERH